MSTTIWILLFGLIELSRCAPIAENAQLVGLIGYFTQPRQANVANFNNFPVPIVFYPILQKSSDRRYLPRVREAVEATEQNTSGTDSLTDVTDKMDLPTGPPSLTLSDIPPIDSLPLGESPAVDLLVPIGTEVPPTIPLPPGPYAYGPSNSNHNVNEITFTTSYPSIVYHPLNMPSQFHQFRPSPLQTNLQFNQFRPSTHFGYGPPGGSTNFITG